MKGHECRFNLIWAIDQQHTTYMSCGESWLELVTFRSQSQRFPSTPHVDEYLYLLSQLKVINVFCPLSLSQNCGGWVHFFRILVGV